MSRARNVIGLAWILTLCALPLAGQTPQPPIAQVLPHTETRYGATIIDNYYWLRDKSNPKVIQYLEEENAYTEKATGPLKTFDDSLYKEMLSHVKQTDLSVPVRRG